MDYQIVNMIVWPQPSKTSNLDIQMTMSGLEYVIGNMTKSVEHKVTQLMVSRGLCSAGLTQSTVSLWNV